MRAKPYQFYNVIINPDKQEIALNVTFPAALKIIVELMGKIFLRDRFPVFKSHKQ